MSKKKEIEYVIDGEKELQDRFLNLALNRFKWEGLPNGLESIDLEKMLIENGQVFFFNDDLIGNLILKCHPTAQLNIYFKPTQLNVYGNCYTKVIEKEKGVLIRNNALASPDIDDIFSFAKRINEIDKTIDLNVNAQKTPYIILCDEKERLTFKNIFNEIQSFKYAIFGSKSMATGINNVNILETKAPYLVDKLQIQKNELMNEMLTFLGINNGNTDKKERMIVDEINVNNDFILVNLDHMYEERKKACDEINTLFGTNITIEKRKVEFDKDIMQDLEVKGVE